MDKVQAKIERLCVEQIGLITNQCLKAGKIEELQAVVHQFYNEQVRCIPGIIKSTKPSSHEDNTNHNTR